MSPSSGAPHKRQRPLSSVSQRGCPHRSAPWTKASPSIYAWRRPAPTNLTEPHSDSFSLFLQLPHAIIVEVTGNTLTVLKDVPVADYGCKRGGKERSGRAVPDPQLVSRHASSALPQLRPLRVVYAATRPSAAARSVRAVLGGKLREDSVPDCVEVSTLSFSSSQNANAYELQWVSAPHLGLPPRQGRRPEELQSLRKYEAFLSSTHHAGLPSGGRLDADGRDDVYDEWMDFHVGEFARVGKGEDGG